MIFFFFFTEAISPAAVNTHGKNTPELDKIA